MYVCSMPVRCVCRLTWHSGLSVKYVVLEKYFGEAPFLLSGCSMICLAFKKLQIVVYFALRKIINARKTPLSESALYFFLIAAISIVNGNLLYSHFHSHFENLFSLRAVPVNFHHIQLQFQTSTQLFNGVHSTNLYNFRYS